MPSGPARGILDKEVLKGLLEDHQWTPCTDRRMCDTHNPQWAEAEQEFNP